MQRRGCTRAYDGAVEVEHLVEIRNLIIDRR
jgi:hypothetical protein